VNSVDSVVERFAMASEPAVRGFLHRPASQVGDALVLVHGAGSNANAPLLVAVAEAMAARGVTVLRCDLPYRQARPGGPPGPGDPARDRAGLKNAVEAVQRLMAGVPGKGRIFLGGHSYGGRQASMLCAELDPSNRPERETAAQHQHGADLTRKEEGLVAGLLLLSYPLHPPRKPEQRRVQHLPKLETPALFVSGTRDPFGTVQELEEALRLIPARTKLMVVEGAGHELMVKKKIEGAQVAGKIAEEFQGFYGMPTL
jgi:predicted alpha/beta-hydrolase family hydrolase